MSSNNDRNDDEHRRDQTSTTDISDGRSVRDESDSLEEKVDHEQPTEEPERALSRSEWEDLGPNPDPESDLGYRVDDWERFDTSDNSNQIIYLPSEESLIEEDAFIVAKEQVLCDLGENY